MTDLHQMTLDELARSRRADPATSKSAARMAHGLASEHRALIVATLRDAGQSLTAGEIAARCGLQSLQVSRRMRELQDDGEVVATGETRPTVSGRAATCWRLVGTVSAARPQGVDAG